MINERFLHFVWRFGYFKTPVLSTIHNEIITIHDPGFWNHDAGPDFQESKLEIGGITWAGHVEIHVKSSDWLAHKHQFDPAYNNVILHVVWVSDVEVPKDVPILELKPIVDRALIKRYELLLKNKNTFLCEERISEVTKLHQQSMLDRALVERLDRKARLVLDEYKEVSDWAEVAYRLLMKYMGFKVNNNVFHDLAMVLPFKVLLKHRDHIEQLEALIFGQAGFLVKEDSYSKKLKKEYEFLSKKYQIKEKMLHWSQWKFLRMRPPNFPTVRLAQVAAIIHAVGDVFSIFIATKRGTDCVEILSVSVSKYWQQHYHFGKRKNQEVNGVMGRSSINHLIINVVAPLRYAYALHQGNGAESISILEFLSSIQKENNRKTRLLEAAGVFLSSAADSQGGIELLDNYCDRKRCLECTIGISILSSSK